MIVLKLFYFFCIFFIQIKSTINKEIVVTATNDVIIKCEEGLYYIQINVNFSSSFNEYYSFPLQLENPPELKLKCIMSYQNKSILCFANLNSNKFYLEIGEFLKLPQNFPKIENIVWDYDSFVKNIYEKEWIVQEDCLEKYYKNYFNKEWGLVYDIKEFYENKCSYSVNVEENKYIFKMKTNLLEGKLKEEIENNNDYSFEIEPLQEIWAPILVNVRKGKFRKINDLSFAFCSINNKISTISKKYLDYITKNGLDFDCYITIPEGKLLIGSIKIEPFYDYLYFRVKNSDEKDNKIIFENFYFNINRTIEIIYNKTFENPSEHKSKNPFEYKQNNFGKKDFRRNEEIDNETSYNMENNENINTTIDNDKNQTGNDKNENEQKEEKNLNNNQTQIEIKTNVIENNNITITTTKIEDTTKENEKIDKTNEVENTNITITTTKIEDTTKENEKIDKTNEVENTNKNNLTTKIEDTTKENEKINKTNEINNNINNNTKEEKDETKDDSNNDKKENINKNNNTLSKNTTIEKKYININYFIIGEQKKIYCPDKPIFVIADSSKDILLFSSEEKGYTIILKGILTNSLQESEDKYFSVMEVLEDISFSLHLIDNLAEDEDDQRAEANCTVPAGTLFYKNIPIFCHAEKISEESKFTNDTDITLNWGLEKNRLHDDIIIKWPNEKRKVKHMYSYNIQGFSLVQTNYGCFNNEFYFYIYIYDMEIETDISFEIEMKNPVEPKAICKLYESSVIRCYFPLYQQKLEKSTTIDLPTNYTYLSVDENGNKVIFEVDEYDYDYEDFHITVKETCGENFIVGALKKAGLNYFKIFLIVIGIAAFAFIVFICFVSYVYYMIKYRNRKKGFVRYIEEDGTTNEKVNNNDLKEKKVDIISSRKD